MQKAAGQMNGLSLHYYTVPGWTGSKKSSHLLKDCREFLKLHEGLAQMNRDIVNRGYGAAVTTSVNYAPSYKPG